MSSNNMKNYFFDNVTFGYCYTVMSESQEEAVNFVKSHIESERIRQIEIESGKKIDWDEFNKLENSRIKGKIKIGRDVFEVKEYNNNEVIETEKS